MLKKNTRLYSGGSKMKWVISVGIVIVFFISGSGARAEDWVYLLSSGNGTSRYDRDSVETREGGTIVFWTKADFTDDGKVSFQEIYQRFEADCKAQKLKTLEARFVPFSGNTQANKSPGPWIRPTTGTVLDVVMKMVCDASADASAKAVPPQNVPSPAHQ